jgi:hypothetical protein
MTTPKNPAAVALQALRKTKTGGRNGGRPQAATRCQCGAMTAARATHRNHRCTADMPKPA